jgi:RHS repeat-associated protein
VYDRGIDEGVVAEMDPNVTGTTTALYPLQDELGNVTHLTDQSGSVVERYQYEGYGKFRIFDPANSPRTVSSYGWNRLFQGREYIGVVDAYDFRARVLWPEMGRFGQEDPAGTVDSLNRYQALLGNWTGNTDPSGKKFVLGGCVMGGYRDECDEQKNLLAKVVGPEGAKYLTVEDRMGKRTGLLGVATLSLREFAKFGLAARALAFIIRAPATVMFETGPGVRITTDQTKGGAYTPTKHLLLDIAFYPTRIGGVTIYADDALVHELAHAAADVDPTVRAWQWEFERLTTPRSIFQKSHPPHEGYGIGAQNEYRRLHGLEPRLLYRDRGDYVDPGPSVSALPPFE